MATHADSATAIVFPGQGSQTQDMESLAATWRPDLLASMRALLGSDPFAGLATSTALAQPAIYCASLAHWECAGRPLGGMVAGHSLGELTALVAAGGLEDEVGLRLAVDRGRLMEEGAVASPGGMLAVLGDPAEHADTTARRFGLAVANENAPGQVVLSGPAEAIEQARRVLRVEGQKAIRLPVAGAFHSPAMAKAAVRFRKLLEPVRFVAPRVPVYSSVLAGPFGDPRDALAIALTKPVRWRQTLQRMHEAGAHRFLETGPGEVLTGLVRRSLPGVEAGPLDAREAASAC